MIHYGNLALSVSRLGLLAAIGMMSVSCIPPSPTPKAAQVLSCSNDQVEWHNITGGVLASGCGKLDVLTYDDAKGVWASLRERAAFEMTCGASELSLTELGADTFGVTGCGHKLVYKSVMYVGLVVQSSSGDGNTSATGQKGASAKGAKAK
jgi:hypothetical protein